MEETLEEIRKSKLFDEAYYLACYPEVEAFPIEHYLYFGADEGKNPSPYFDTAYYLKAYPEVAKADYNPLLHYIRVGQRAGYSPCPTKLSIIIPHKNSATALGKLLKSIADEDESVAVFVVDDHSDTKELESLKRLKEKYPSYRFLTNEGMYAGTARNTALKQAVSQWVLFADADDYFLPGWYDEVCRHFQSGADLVFFPPTSVNLVTGKLGQRHLNYQKIVNAYRKNPWLMDEAIRFQMCPPWSKLVRMDFLRKHDLSFGEEMVSNDVMFSLKTGFYAQNIIASKVPIYCVTEGNYTLTTHNTLERLKIRADVIRQYNDFLKENYDDYFALRKKCTYLHYNAIEAGFNDEEIIELLVHISRLGLDV